VANSETVALDWKGLQPPKKYIKKKKYKKANSPYEVKRNTGI
jgi:hypothetical protein